MLVFTKKVLRRVVAIPVLKNNGRGYSYGIGRTQRALAEEGITLVIIAAPFILGRAVLMSFVFTRAATGYLFLLYM